MPRWSGVQYATTPDGVRIAYQTVGDGPIDLISVPGFTSHLDLMHDIPGFDQFFERLARFARVTLFDKRSTGLSDRGLGHPSLDQQAIDVETVLDAVGAEHATLFGWSEGAAISTLLAASRPDRVERLILYAGTACMRRRPDYPAGIPDDELARLGSLMTDAWGSMSHEFGPVLFPSHVDDADYLQASTRAYRAASSPAEATGGATFVAELDYRHVLPAVRVPALVVHREGDRFVPVEMGRYLAEQIPGARYVELPGDDHPPWSGDTDALAARVESFVTGRRAAAPTQRMLTTVMFSDIVASTERLAALGDAAWRQLLQRHDRLVAEHIEASGGVLVKSLGDGCLARFGLPGRAIQCARDLVDSTADLGLQLRVGLHTGEVEVLGDDISGMAVHIAARIAGEAPAGGILATSTVKDLVAGGGFRFAEAGSRQLKGIEEPWHVFEVQTEVADARSGG